MKNLFLATATITDKQEVFVREYLAKNSKVQNVLKIAKTDEHDLVRQAYAANANITDAELLENINSSDLALVIGSAKNPKASSKQLEQLYSKNKNILVLEAMAVNPNISSKFLESLFVKLTNSFTNYKHQNLYTQSTLHKVIESKKLALSVIENIALSKYLLITTLKNYRLSSGCLSELVKLDNIERGFVNAVVTELLLQDLSDDHVTTLLASVTNFDYDYNSERHTDLVQIIQSSSCRLPVLLDCIKNTKYNKHLIVLALNNSNATQEVLDLIKSLDYDEKTKSIIESRLTTNPQLQAYLDSDDISEVAAALSNPNATETQITSTYSKLSSKDRSSTSIKSSIINNQNSSDLLVLEVIGMLSAGLMTISTCKKIKSKEIAEIIFNNAIQSLEYNVDDHAKIIDISLETSSRLGFGLKIPKVTLTMCLNCKLSDTILMGFPLSQVQNSDINAFFARVKHPTEKFMLEILPRFKTADSCVKMLDNKYVTDKVYLAIVDKLRILAPKYIQLLYDCEGISLASLSEVLKSKSIINLSTAITNSKITAKDLLSILDFAQSDYALFATTLRYLQKVLTISNNIFKEDFSPELILSILKHYKKVASKPNTLNENSEYIDFLFLALCLKHENIAVSEEANKMATYLKLI